MKRYNWKPDLPDIRDKKYSIPEGAVLPASADLQSQCPPVFDQGQIGSCTGNSLCGNLEFLQLRELTTKQVNQPEEFATTFEHASRLFVYYNERDMEGDVNQDGGAQIRDGIKTLATLGACSEINWPYNPANLFIKPGPVCYQEASNKKISQYIRLETLSDMKHCIASGFPFVFGFTVYDQMESQQMAADGQLQMPSPSDSPMGGHAVMAVGYDDATQMFKIRNSWGPTWGVDGYFFMPYAYISNSDLTSDFWSIRL